MLDKVKEWIADHPWEAAAIFAGIGAGLTYLVLLYMKKIKK